VAGTNRRSTGTSGSRSGSASTRSTSAQRTAKDPRGRRRLIDYPRRGYTGFRRWIPSWRFVVGSITGFVFLCLGVGVAAYALTEVPEPDAFVEDQTSTAYFSDGTTPIGTFPGPNRNLVDYDSLPAYVGQAVVAAEDRTFFENQGVSITGMARAFYNNITGGKTQGGSTLTQQYVERYYVGSTTTSYLGKAKETLMAIKIAQTETKEQILGRYLNTIYFGRDSYGIDAASLAYFGHSSAELTVPEAAMLAGIIPSPNNWDPAVSPDKAEQRWNYVLDHMVEDGYVTQADRDAMTFPAVVPFERSDTYGGTNGYLLQYVKAELIANGVSDEIISSGGLKITTTVDVSAQQMAVDAVGRLRSGELSDGEQPSANLKVGVVTTDPASGGIVAMYGGDDFLADQYNRATYAVQAGSTFKPFTLLAALEEGIPLTSRYNGNSPQTIDGWDGSAVNNFGGTDYGNIDLIKATAQSVNTVYAQLNLEVGPEKTAQIATDSGITTPVSSVASNVLGVDDVKPVDMANAYATLAAQGQHHQTYMVREAAYPDGDVAYSGDNQATTIYSADVAADATYAMTQVVQQGSGKTWVKPLGREIAGKTGTSNENKSAWFMGFTPNVVTAVALSQVGEDGNSRVTIDPWGGVSEVTGSTWPAALWASYMEQIFTLPQYAEELSFPDRANVGATSAPVQTAVPTEAPTEEAPAEPEQPATVAVPSGLEGLLSSDAQAAVTNAGLAAQVVEQTSSSVASGRVISISPGAGSQVAPGSAVTIVVSTGPEVVPDPAPTATQPAADAADPGTGG
jgi:membrane peptidoglycan carboxypeptidase